MSGYSGGNSNPGGDYTVMVRCVMCGRTETYASYILSSIRCSNMVPTRDPIKYPNGVEPCNGMMQPVNNGGHVDIRGR